MANIKITEKQHEIKGTLKKGNVKPFGNSAHIPFPKEHTGKIVDVIIPDEPLYTWVFSETLRAKLCDLAKKKADSLVKDRHYFLGYIEEFSKKEFSFEAITKIVFLLEDEPSVKKYVSEIKSAYNL
jgi:putative transposon-encoded protein